MPRHIETCYVCEAEYEIIYSAIDHSMRDDEEYEDIDIDEEEINDPKYCPFCGSEL